MLTSAGLLGFGCVTGLMIANSVAVEVRGGRILSVEASGRVQDAENMIRKVPKQSLATSRTTTAPAAALTDTPTSKEMGNCAVVSVITCDAFNTQTCSKLFNLKTQYSGLEKNVLATQGCTVVYVASKGVRSHDIWKHLGYEARERARIVSDVVESDQRVYFESGRTSQGQVILVGEWLDYPRPGLPSGISTAEEFLNTSTACGGKAVWPGRTRPPNYVDGTTWYVYPMLSLKLLHQFDTVMKIDLDVIIFRPIVFDLHNEMQGKVFGHTSKFCHCTPGLKFEQVSRDFMKSRGITPPAIIGSNCDSLYYSNFVMINMTFFSRPDVLALAKRFYTEPCGFYWAGWEDQVVWHHLMGIFLGQSWEDYTKDFSELRCTGDKACYTVTQRCEQSHIFVHSQELPSNVGGNQPHPWDSFDHSKDKISYSHAMRIAKSRGARCKQPNVACLAQASGEEAAR